MKQKPTVQPTADQRQWLKENHKTYTMEYIATKMGVCSSTMREWFKTLGILKRVSKAIAYTDEQKRFIKDNYKTMQHAQIAERLGLSISAIQGYCFRNKLTKKRGWLNVVKEPKRIILGPPKKDIQRPPAQYSNTSREQHVEKWINTEVPTQRKRIGYNQQKKTA